MQLSIWCKRSYASIDVAVGENLVVAINNAFPLLSSIETAINKLRAVNISEPDETVPVSDVKDLVGHDQHPFEKWIHERYELVVYKQCGTLYPASSCSIKVDLVDEHSVTIRSESLIVEDGVMGWIDLCKRIADEFGVQPGKIFHGGKEISKLIGGSLKEAGVKIGTTLQFSAMQPNSHCSDLVDNLGQLVDSGSGSDIKIVCVCGVRTFHLHRALLIARSAVFSAMLLPRADGSMSEEAMTGIIAINDIHGDIVKSLVECLYTGKCTLANQSQSSLDSLLYAADKYELADMVKHCEVHFGKTLSVDNAVDVALAADRYRATTLRQAALDFIKRNVQQVLSDGGEEAKEKLVANPKLLFDVLATTMG